MTCLILAALALRPGLVIGPILPDVIEEFAVTRAQASLLTAVPAFLMGFLALPTPWLVHRFGRDRVIVAALVLLALATVGRAVSGSLTMLIVMMAGVGAGIAIAGTLVPGFVKARFPDRPALVMGVYATALSIGTTAAAGATGVLAQLSGTWRVPAGLWALPALVGALAWLHVEKRHRVVQSTHNANARHRLPVGDVKAWLIAAFCALNNIVFYSYISWIAPIYVEFGLSVASAGLVLACFTIAFTVATPLFGWLSRTSDRRLHLAIATGISFVGVVWIVIAPTVLPIVIVSLVGFGTGGAFTLSLTLPLDSARSDDEAAAWNAFVMLVGYSVGAAGPLLVGLLRDSSGGFELPGWAIIGVIAAMLAITPLLKPHQHERAKGSGGLASTR